MKGVQCYELFGGIALKNHAFFFFSFSLWANYSRCLSERLSVIDFCGLWSRILSESAFVKLI